MAIPPPPPPLLTLTGRHIPEGVANWCPICRSSRTRRFWLFGKYKCINEDCPSNNPKSNISQVRFETGKEMSDINYFMLRYQQTKSKRYEKMIELLIKSSLFLQIINKAEIRI